MVSKAALLVPVPLLVKTMPKYSGCMPEMVSVGTFIVTLPVVTDRLPESYSKCQFELNAFSGT